MVQVPAPINHTSDAIYGAIAKRARGGDSVGVPISAAGEECSRKLWFQLRWANPREVIDGQKQRRFETGFIEEDRLLDDLEAAGVRVERLDPATGKQFRVELANGWLRGKMDGLCEGLPDAPKTLHVVECKSHKESSFKELVKKKLRDGKPDHYAQVQLYLYAHGLNRGLYLAVNKNTEEIYAERVEYDAAFAMQIEAKVARIVDHIDIAPPRLHEDPTSKAAFACAWCPALSICHEGAFARRNCRTCLSASFEQGAVVRCTLQDKVLSYDEQQRGCGEHRYLPALVNGEQIDADPETRTIMYALASGETWVDGGAG